MSDALDLRPPYCRAFGVSFALDALWLDAKGKPAGRLAVPADELLQWVEIAATYSPAFAEALLQRLNSINHTAMGGSDAVRQA